MRAGLIALGLVIVAVAASFGVVMAQKPTTPWVSTTTALITSTSHALLTQVTAAVTPTASAKKPAAATPAQPAAAPPAAAPVAGAPVAPPVVATAAMVQAAAPAAPPVPAVAPLPTCANPNALGIARVVEVDTTGGPGFGFEHFKQHDFLRAGEVVLTFDDGPWLNNTPAVLKALADQCVKAIFFPIGKHATYYPDILKQVAEAGHTIGSHTWSHQDLSKKSFEEAKEEIEKGVSAVRMAVGAPTAPFFRFPALRHPPEVVTYLGERNIGIFSTDMDSFDFKIRKPEQVVASVMNKLKKHGKGIVLMHDFQHATAEAVPQLLGELKAAGFKIVHMKAKDAVQSLAQYDEMVMKDQKLPTVSARPTSSVVRTVAE
jgi:peptidoglycan/xylan/chitin deacetylase (PgdA/CDA1 family)